MKDKLLFLDTETTGVEETDRICQVAYKIGGEKAWQNGLFKPPVPISIEAMSITHITNEHVEDRPAFKGSQFEALLSQTLLDENTILIAHNAEYDLKMLLREGVPMPKRHICTMKVAHHHDKEAALTRHNLQYLRYYHGLKFYEVINPHDALSDILVLEKVFQFYAKFYSIEEMVKISSQPILIKRMPFGKHKGKLMKEICDTDRGYLEWLWSSLHVDVNVDVNMKYTVGYYLKGHHRLNNF